MSGGFADNWGGVGMTLVDSLDTLWLLGLRAEFDEAAEWAIHNLTLRADSHVSVFEYNIRLLGGLLSAYELSGKQNQVRVASSDYAEQKIIQGHEALRLSATIFHDEEEQAAG